MRDADDATEWFTQRALSTLEQLFDASALTEAQKGDAAMNLGFDLIMSCVARVQGAEPQHLMVAIRALLAVGVKEGWLPPQPAGTARVLVLNEGTAETRH